MSDLLTILDGSNAAYVEALYEDYLTDPNAVPDAWRQFFDGQRNGAADVPHRDVVAAFAELAAMGPSPVIAVAPATDRQGARGDALVEAIRTQGHLQAAINPLFPAAAVETLSPAHHGLGQEDLAAPYSAGPFRGTLQSVLDQLLATYCGPIGFELSHLPETERAWFQQRIEAWGGTQLPDVTTRQRALMRLTAAEGLERYLHKRYVGQKRFSLEGGEALIPMLDQLIQRGGATGVRECVIGMAHRGRLNVLINVLGKKPSDLFAEFEGKKALPAHLAGDVKYHMGFSSDVETPGGKMHLTLAFNPSHLELVNAVVEGSVRARQDRRRDASGASVLPVLIHGDAAVIGQGIVAECLNLSQLRGFKTGGTLHLVVNNQVGFSVSDPRDTRTSRYCTDIGKMVDAPAFHVNGDDPDACLFAVNLALEYRQAFGKDVFVDLLCFRRHGHNESDEPRATQPQMYHTIDAHPGTRQLYADKLVAGGVVSADFAQKAIEETRDLLDLGARTIEAVETDLHSEAAKAWAPFVTAPADVHSSPDTGVALDRLLSLGTQLTSPPEGFQLHKRIQAILEDRKRMLASELAIDWGFAENLAYASLLTEGHPVRISGQDSGRGTFFHRHAIWHDQRAGLDYTEKAHLPLAHLAEGQARVDVIDSTLSEEAVLAFEYGYAATEPSALVIWEAQYGDFANGAQAVIDQYIAAGEVKWQRLSGVVMMLPHGYEGQGPEHSSARLERYMSLCADDNLQVAVPSTAAQMFHLLRRQVKRGLRKPLVIMSPKSMLRMKSAASSLQDLAQGRFQEVIGDDLPPSSISRVVLCSGKLYHELAEARTKHQLSDVALVRIEQLYPFPSRRIVTELATYAGAKTIVWAQEEPQNNGAWGTIRDELEAALAPGQTLRYAGRPRAASPAVGSTARHNEQQAALIEQALFGARVPTPETANA
ncbi:MAG: 2-oxoglutarate dehydrogenase E1 component [Candidatus Sericytochromatia bacterium]|nr:2-oxoglutarate dehydrogenase E1 component [Candidatus Sericytochromatia bacterium]